MTPKRASVILPVELCQGAAFYWMMRGSECHFLLLVCLAIAQLGVSYTHFLFSFCPSYSLSLQAPTLTDVHALQAYPPASAAWEPPNPCTRCGRQTFLRRRRGKKWWAV